MATPPKDGKLLYHLTAIDNLDSIFEKGLLPRKKISCEYTNVADEAILGKRNNFELEDFIPFHFFAGTPFSGAVQIKHDKTEFVYITLHRDRAKVNKFKIIPSHPVHFNGEPLEWGKGLETIDWDLMSKRQYSDNDCCQCCMAESIFNRKIPPEAFHSIFVQNDEVKQKVVTLKLKHKLDLDVNVNTTFFKKK